MSLEGDFKWLHMLRWVRRVGWVYICGMIVYSVPAVRGRDRGESDGWSMRPSVQRIAL